MCYRPIRIRTARTSFDPRYDKLYNTVPCGHCGECLTTKQNDYMIRSFFQMKDVTDAGGKCIFVTLTYNNSNLPHFQLCERSVAAFDKTHVQKFLHLFRKRLQRNYNVPVKSVKYCWFCEYGGNTHRPHYHALLYIYDKLHLSVIQKIIRELWHYGFVSFSKNGGLVDTVHACKYVTKYVIKDLDFYGNLDTSSLITLKQDAVKFQKVKNRYFPFHLQSTNFGVAISRYLSEEQLVNSTIPIPCNNGYQIFHTPQYIDRKLFYTRDNKNSYCLTPSGVEMKLHRHAYVRDNFIKSINNTLCNLDTLVNSQTWPYIDDKLFRSGNSTRIDLACFKRVIRNFFVCNELSDFVDYSFNKSDVMRLDCNSITRKFHPVKFASLRERLLNLRPINCSAFADVSSDKDQLRRANYYIYNNFLPYAEFDTVSRYLDAVRYAVGALRNNDYERQRKQRSAMKHTLNLSRYA